jgi:AbrB family looped-hinge helix DNA binding protein
MADVITIDDAGRVVIPKRIREHLGLKGGSQLRIAEEGGRVVLESMETPYELVEKQGILVIRGRTGDPLPDHRELREERIAHLAKRGSRK